MLTISLRDLQFRRRRFAVGIAGTALVLGITLVLSGIPAGFNNEARRSVDAFHGQAWILPNGVTGPFLSTTSMPTAVADQVHEASGYDAAPVAVLGGVLTRTGYRRQVNIHGIPRGSFARPALHDGRYPAQAGELVVNSTVRAHIGDRVQLNGRAFVVVGRTSGLSYNAGVATVSMLITDAQAMGFGGGALATGVVVRGPIAAAPTGYHVVTSDDVRRDLLAPLKSPKQTIVFMQWLLWLVATMIVGSVVYLSALDRLRDFAVFKAMGADDRSVVGGLISQSLLLCAIAYAVGVGLSKVIAPFLPIHAEVPRFAYLGLAGVAVVVAMLASVAGARRAISVDPVTAFGGA